MKTDRQHQSQQTRWLKSMRWIIVMGWCIVALAFPLEGQAAERQSVVLTVASSGAYTLRGDQNAIAVRALTDGIQATYRAPSGLEILTIVSGGGCLHLDLLEARVQLMNTGTTDQRTTLLDKTITLAPGARIEISGNPTQATVNNRTSLIDSAAWAASDAYLNALAEQKVLGQVDKETAVRLETTYQTAFVRALQQKRPVQDAARDAQEAVVGLNLPQAIRSAATLMAETTNPQISAAANFMLKQAAAVRVEGQQVAVGETTQIRAPLTAAAQRAALEPGQRGVVRVDTGFRPAVNGFSFANYGGEYPHGDLTAEDARTIFGDQACANAGQDPCLASPATYIWVSRLNRVLKYGHCEGMAVLSALLFTGQEQPPQYGGQSAADLRPSRPALIRAIGRYAAMQMLSPVWNEAAAFRVKTPAEILDVLTGALKKNQFYTMGLYGAAGAQTVLPYAVEDVGNGNLWVHVYDPNYPQEGKYVEIDPAANRWRYEGVEGGVGTIDLTAVATRQQVMASPFASDLSATLLLIDSQTADFAIIAANGKTLRAAAGQMANSIPGAVITRVRGKEKLLGDRGASLSEQESAGTIFPLLVSLPLGQEYLVRLSVAGELTAEELTAAPDDLKGKEKILLEERGKEKLISEEERGKEKLVVEEERGKEKLISEEERGKEKLVMEEERGKEKVVQEEERGKEKAMTEEERGKEKAVQEEERGKEKVVQEEERGKEKIVQEEDRGKEKVVQEEERGKEKVVQEEERGAAGEARTTNPIWMVVFQPQQAYLFDRILPKSGAVEQLLLTADGAVRYYAGANQQLTVVAGSAVARRANARYTIKKIALNPGRSFTIGQQPATGQTWFRTNDPAIAALDTTIRIEDGQTSQRYAYPTLTAPLTGQHVVALQADGRFRIGIDANLDGIPEEHLADADADGIPDGFTLEAGSPKITPGAQGKLVADTGFRPDQHGFSFENYAKNQYPYGDLTIDDAWRMFGDQVCETVKNGVCYPAPATQLWVEKMNQSMQRGHCEGMAVLSMWLYTQEEAVPGFSGRQAYALDPSYEALLRKIAYYWTTQTLEPVKSSYLAFRAKTPTQIVQTLIEAMHAKSETYTIGIYGRGGHAVTPYAVEDIGQGVFWVHVYDNNYPGVGKYIEIDTHADTWKYAGAALNPADDASPWEGGTGKIDLTPSSVRRQPLTCAFCPSKDKSAPKTVTVMVDGNGVNVTAATSDGKTISMTNGQANNHIPGAQITAIKGVDERDERVAAVRSDIFGTDRMTLLTLPANADYKITLASGRAASGETAWVGILQEGVMFVIDDLLLGAGPSDQLTVSKDGMIGYVPGQQQRPTLSVGTNTPGKDGLYTVSNVTLSPNGGGISMGIHPDTGALAMQSSDPGMTTASVLVTGVNGTAMESVLFDNVSLTAGLALSPEIDLSGPLTAGLALSPEIDLPVMDEIPVTQVAGIDESTETEDVQTMTTELQTLVQDNISGSVPGAIDDQGGIDLPEPGDGDGNNQPQRVRIPVIIVPQ